MLQIWKTQPYQAKDECQKVNKMNIKTILKVKYISHIILTYTAQRTIFDT